MSDFLNQFNDNSYKKTESSPEVKKEESFSANTREAQKEGIAGPQHQTVIDKSFQKNKNIRLAVILGAVVLAIIAGVFIFRAVNAVTVKNLVGTDLNDSKSWAVKSGLDFDVSYEFSVQYDNNQIVSQSVAPNKKVQKGTIIAISVSKGANPDEHVQLPDFKTMNTDQVKAWITDNKMTDVSVVQEYSDDVPSGAFLRQEFKDPTVNESNYKRSDILVVYMSQGKQSFAKNISVPDFTSKQQSEAVTWASTNNITLTATEAGSDTISAGAIISQSVAAGNYLAQNDSMSIVVSLGKGVTVPDFNTVSKSDAQNYVSGLTTTVRSQYSTTVPYGKVISQSVSKNTVLYGTDKKVTVVYSEGKPYIDKMVGRSEKTLPAYFYDFTSKGANITYSVEYVDSGQQKGTIIWASIENEFVGLNENVDLKVSKGNLPAETQLADPSGGSQNSQSSGGSNSSGSNSSGSNSNTSQQGSGSGGSAAPQDSGNSASSAGMAN